LVVVLIEHTLILGRDNSQRRKERLQYRLSVGTSRLLQSNKFV